MRYMRVRSRIPTVLLLASIGLPLIAQQTPPMGWNSWDSYGLSVTEAEFKANASWMAQHLKRYGWQYAVVDEGWYLKNPEAKPSAFQFTLSGDGRYLPAVNRFPSSANGAGFKPLADSIHALGLKFGIHIIRGIPKQAAAKNVKIAESQFTAGEASDRNDTCPWNADNYGVRNTPAGQAYYDSIAKLYASWGVDFVKIDCIAADPYKGDEIQMFSDALRGSGRQTVLSLSPGPAPLEKSGDLRQYANMWRISGDVWDHWQPWPKLAWSQGLLGQFKLAANWAAFVGGGHWPDADMLPLGHLGPRPGTGKERESAFTAAEQRSLLTLWAMFRSPLVMGGNLTRMDASTTALLTNEEVIAVNQRSSSGRAVVNDGKQSVWVAKGQAAGELYVALFNLSDRPQTISYPVQALGARSTSGAVRDLWERKDLGQRDLLKAALEPHACILYRIKL
jgi:alpha-galactosidase